MTVIFWVFIGLAFIASIVFIVTKVFRLLKRGEEIQWENAERKRISREVSNSKRDKIKSLQRLYNNLDDTTKYVLNHYSMVDETRFIMNALDDKMVLKEDIKRIIEEDESV